MKFDKVIILLVVTVVIVTGLVGYQIWLKSEPTQTPVETVETPACDICSALKKDLAEQVKERKQKP